MIISWKGYDIVVVIYAIVPVFCLIHSTKLFRKSLVLVTRNKTLYKRLLILKVFLFSINSKKTRHFSKGTLKLLPVSYICRLFQESVNSCSLTDFVTMLFSTQKISMKSIFSSILGSWINHFQKYPSRTDSRNSYIPNNSKSFKSTYMEVSF